MNVWTAVVTSFKISVAPNNAPSKHKPYLSKTWRRQNTWLIPHIKRHVFWSYYHPKMEMDVYVDTHHIRWRHLYVMPLASTFMDEETMDGCIRKAVEWCEGLPSHYATHVKKISMSETIGVTLKGRVWCWASMVVAEVVCGINSACVFITLYPC